MAVMEASGIMSFSSHKMRNHVQNIRENIHTTPKVRNHLIFYAFAVLMYSLMHVYLGIRIYQAFMPAFGKITLSLLMLCLGLLFPLTAATLDQGREAKPLSRLFAYAGYYWAAFFLYSVMMIMGIDLFRLIDWLNQNRLFNSVPNWEKPLLPSMAGAAVVIITLALLTVGTWLARRPRVRHYDISMNKPMRRPLKVVLLSDIGFTYHARCGQ
jgi:hypothetical protein